MRAVMNKWIARAAAFCRHDGVAFGPDGGEGARRAYVAGATG